MCSMVYLLIIKLYLAGTFAHQALNQLNVTVTAGIFFGILYIEHMLTLAVAPARLAAYVYGLLGHIIALRCTNGLRNKYTSSTLLQSPQEKPALWRRSRIIS